MQNLVLRIWVKWEVRWVNKLHHGWENGSSVQSWSVKAIGECGVGSRKGSAVRWDLDLEAYAGGFSFFQYFPVKRWADICSSLSHSVTVDWIPTMSLVNQLDGLSDLTNQTNSSLLEGDKLLSSTGDHIEEVGESLSCPQGICSWTEMATCVQSPPELLCLEKGGSGPLATESSLLGGSEMPFHLGEAV